jgi:hypothetical protein
VWAPRLIRLYGFLAVGRPLHLEADCSEHPLEKRAIIFVVIGYQDAMARLSGLLSGYGAENLLLRDGFGDALFQANLQPKDTSFSRSAADSDRPAHQVGEFVTDGQTKARASQGASACGGLLEGLEESAQFLLGDAGARILDFG